MQIFRFHNYAIDQVYIYIHETNEVRYNYFTANDLWPFYLAQMFMSVKIQIYDIYMHINVSNTFNNIKM